MDASTPPLSATPQAVFRPLDAGGVVLNIETGDYYELNASGRLLWEELEARGSRPALVEALVNRYGIDHATAEGDVDAFLGELRSRQLLEP